MKFVYILQSIADDSRHYTGVTDDLEDRLKKHSDGEVTHTRKYKPWRLQTYIAFSDDARAYAFEQYLKSGSGALLRKKDFERLRRTVPR